MRTELDLHRKIRWLTQWLVLSLAANAALLTSLAWVSWSHRGDQLTLTLKPGAPTQHPTLAQALHQIGSLTWDQLVEQLRHDTPIEFGFTQRDLALSRLVDHYGFDLSRALGRSPQQQRCAQIGQTKYLLYPGLDDGAFQRIVRLIEQERFPLTAAGCLRWLQDRPDLEERDRKDLLVCLGHSDAWRAVEDLFQAIPPVRSREQLVQLATEVDWAPFATFWEQQRHSRDLSLERRYLLLSDCLRAGSSLAGRWLLEEAPQWAQQRLPDPQILQLVALRDVEARELRPILRAILSSPRSDSIRQFAAQRLYALDGEVPPQPLSLAHALAKYCPEIAPTLVAHCSPTSSSGSGSPGAARAPSHESAKPKAVQVVPVTSKPATPAKPTKPAPSRRKLRVIQVRQGDTLSKISKRYGVPVQEIRQLNEMHSDRLAPGATLLLPPEKKS